MESNSQSNGQSLEAAHLRPIFGGTQRMHISPIGLGTVKFGRNTDVKYPQPFEIPDDKSLGELISFVRDLGINLLDTAPAYGTAEERLGHILEGQRADWILVSKAGEFYSEEGSSFDFRPAAVRRSVEQSLRRLRTDWLDILLLHSDGRDQDLMADENLLRVLEDLKQEGKIRACGLSGKTCAGGMEALEKLDCVMAAYNAFYTEEEPVLDYAASLGKPVFIKKALASGNLSGVAVPGQAELSDPVESAMRFTLSHPGVTSIVIGSINMAHIRQNVQAVRTILDDLAFFGDDGQEEPYGPAKVSGFP